MRIETRQIPDASILDTYLSAPAKGLSSSSAVLLFVEINLDVGSSSRKGIRGLETAVQ